MSLAGLVVACVILLLSFQNIHAAAAPVTCGPPPEVAGAVIQPEDTDSFQPGDSVSYSCEFDYYLEGEDTITCSEEGTWEGARPSCNWYCFEPSPIRYGKITFPGHEEGVLDFRSGEKAVYKCDPEFELSGPAVRRCMSDGEWEGDDSRYVSCVRAKCPDPGIPAHGRRIGNSFNVGDTVGYVCYSRYRMYGSSNRTCKPNLRWDGAVPTCDPLDTDCPVPPVPAGGAIIGSSYKVGDEIEYHCQKGFILLGDPIRTCMQDGEWSGEEVFCDAPAAYDEIPDLTERLKPGLDRIALASSSSKDTLLVQGPQPLTAMSDILKHHSGVDFYFVFDVSGSISEEELHDSVEFAVALVDKLGVNPEPEAAGTTFGAAYFNREAKVHFHTVQFNTKEKIIKALRQINETRGGTNIADGLKKVYEIMIPQTKKTFQKRVDSKTAILLFSDGMANEGGDAVKIKESLQNDYKAEIFTIMTKTTRDNSDETKEKLSKLASTPWREYFFSMRDVSEFRELIPKMLGNPIDYSRCGVAGRAQDLHSERGRIVFGAVVREGAWPWMVGVKIWDEQVNPAPKVLCGGTLIDKEWVVTAAHCFDLILQNKPGKTLQMLAQEDRFSVLLGTVINPTADTEEVRAPPSAKTIPVDAVYVHTDYNRNTFYGDIAVLHLSFPALLNVNVRPACLPEEGEDVYHRDDGLLKWGWVTGWGHSEAKPHTDKTVRFEPDLRQVTLPIQTNVTCQATIHKIQEGDPSATINYDDSSMFCAGFAEPVNNTIPDACQGDSGGPFVVKTVNRVTRQVQWKLAGIVSDGYGCGQKEVYGLYTRLDAFLGWLKQTMASHK